VYFSPEILLFVDVDEMPNLFLDALRANPNTKCNVRIMGIQDNYKPWSRKNPLNAKPFVFHPDIQQMFFDDYIFSKAESMGSYIVSLYKFFGGIMLQFFVNVFISSSSATFSGTKMVVR